MTVSVAQAMVEAVATIAAAGVGDTARLDAELLLGEATGLDRVGLRVQDERELTGDEARDLARMVARRVAGEPIAYILGNAWFWGREFFVDDRVLVPRPETEALVEVALTHFADHARSATFVDACTGSGCVAISIAAELGGRARVFGTDISTDALDVARANAIRHGVEVELRAGDLLEPVADLMRVGVVVANPPYVDGVDADGLAANVRDHEPHVALFAPEEGVEAFYRRLAVQARDILEPGGLLVVEHGQGQRGMVAAAMHAAGLVDIEGRDDLAGIDRLVIAHRGDEDGA